MAKPEQEGSINKSGFRAEAAADRLRYDIKVECAEVASKALQNKIMRKAKEAHKEGLDLAVSPIFENMDERPTTLGYYLKLKLEYTFLKPEQDTPTGWTRYNTAKIDPDLV